MQDEKDREVLFWDVSVKSRVLIFIQTVAFCWNQGFFECHEWFSFELISASANFFIWWNPGLIINLLCFYIWTFEPEDRNLQSIANDILCQTESCLDNMLSFIIQALISSVKKYYFGIDFIIQSDSPDLRVVLIFIGREIWRNESYEPWMRLLIKFYFIIRI